MTCIRRPTSQDRSGIEQMWGRCSAKTRLDRLHSPFPNLPTSYMDAVIAEPDGSRVAATPSGEVVGLASLLDSGKGWADLGVIVEDRWQRKGLGRCLVSELFADIGVRGIRVVKADLLASNAALVRPLRHFDRGLSFTSCGHTVEVTMRPSAAPPSSR
jgi:GNAT superfamily N-acetyltransferase